MCKTAIIMSEAEAMALPQSKRPLNFRVPSAIYTAVWEAVGAASMCWKPRPGNQVFATEEASNVAVNLCFKIAEELERLGVTTEMMRDVKTPHQFRCKTCQEPGTIYIKEIGMHFCESCLRKIDARMMSLNEQETAPQPPPPKSKLETAEAEVARLENIVKIQQKQIERLMEQRDKVLLDPEHRTIATALPSGAIVQAECRHEYEEGSTVCRICGS